MGENQVTINKINIRLLAIKALTEINRQGAYANIVLAHYIRTYALHDLDRRFFTELVYGVIRRRNYLDAIIVALTNKPIHRLSSIVVEILRLGLYQIFYMDKVPHTAAVNESVKLAKKFVRGLSGFVNGVLRNAIRNIDDLSIDKIAHDENERIAYTYNQPLWLIQRWKREMGLSKTIGLCEWFNEQPRLIARINTLKISIEDCLIELAQSGWIIEQHEYIKEAVYIISHRGSLSTHPLVVAGKIAFMDIASMLVAHVVAPKDGDYILDVCAAPGGKTMHLAAMMHNTGHIIAGDIHEHKLALMNQNAKRLGVTNVETRLQDGRDLHDLYGQSFDKVLVDAPCSGLGILQKKLDMRWRKNEKHLDELPKLQSVILDEAAKVVKDGGILVYSTCTINHLENEDVVNHFLMTHKDFIVDDISEYLHLPTSNKMLAINPATDRMDGFFMARLRKEKL